MAGHTEPERAGWSNWRVRREDLATDQAERSCALGGSAGKSRHCQCTLHRNESRAFKTTTSKIHSTASALCASSSRRGKRNCARKKAGNGAAFRREGSSSERAQDSASRQISAVFRCPRSRVKVAAQLGVTKNNSTMMMPKPSVGPLQGKHKPRHTGKLHNKFASEGRRATCGCTRMRTPASRITASDSTLGWAAPSHHTLANSVPSSERNLPGNTH